MTSQFDKTVTVYHRNGNTWSKTTLDRVYYHEDYKLDENSTERTSYKVRTCIIPTSTLAIDVGDIIIAGTCTQTIGEYGSGNNVIRAGGWVVKTVADNRHQRCSVSHVEVSDG